LKCLGVIMQSKPLVSVCVFTYNHERYVRDAMDGISRQRISFPIEVIVGDDCSNDNTTKILLEFKKKWPHPTRLIFNNKNLGCRLNAKNVRAEAAGTYIAQCEGDDYWTDPHKLQRQVDFLESHPDYSICSHNVVVKYEETEKQNEWLGRKQKQVITIQDVLRYGSAGATCSLVFKRSLIHSLPAWFYSLPSADWAIQVLSCSNGKMKYFPEPMAVYRRHNTGMTAVQTPDDLVRIFNEGGVKICEVFDKHFDFKYHDDIEYNLVNYFYPQLLHAYLQIGDRVKVAKYARNILRNNKSLPVKNKLALLYYSSWLYAR
jgi:glycosyltransferase involved in cell wall biosynthesis